MKIKDISKRQPMKEICKSINFGKETIQVILQFPEFLDESKDAVMIKESVKSILMMELQEQVKNITTSNLN